MFGDAVVLNSSQVDAQKIQFFGASARLGYRITPDHEIWSFRIMGGLYYLSASTTDNSFGFQNLMGPQIFPVLSRTFNSGSTLSISAKYAPVGTGFTVDPSSREIAGGIAWSQSSQLAHPISYSFYISDLSAQVEKIRVESSSFGLSIGVGF
jgi:hypothetical protein